MNSASSSLHSFFTSASPYLALASGVVALLAVGYALLLSRRLDKLTFGNGGSVEDTLGVLTAHMKDSQAFRRELEVYLKHTETRLRSAVRGVGVVRYNPFANDGSSGGNQSFAIAFIDETLSGVVFSALYSRDRVGVYAKPLTGGKSTFTLSEEEQEALTKATTSLADKREQK